MRGAMGSGLLLSGATRMQLELGRSLRVPLCNQLARKLGTLLSENSHLDPLAHEFYEEYATKRIRVTEGPS